MMKCVPPCDDGCICPKGDGKCNACKVDLSFGKDYTKHNRRALWGGASGFVPPFTCTKCKDRNCVTCT